MVTVLRGRAGSQDIPSAELEGDDGRDSDRRAVSRRGNRHKFPLPVNRKGKTSAGVFTCPLRSFRRQGTPTHHRRSCVGHGAGHTATLLRVERNSIFPIHVLKGSLGEILDSECNFERTAHVIWATAITITLRPQFHC